MGCYAMNYLWNKGTFGDARTQNGEVVEMKATSNFDRDLTSFSPSMEFDKLIFLRLNQSENKLYIYDTGLDTSSLGNVMVNSNQTLRDQQIQGRRPRFSIIKNIIEPNNLSPVAIFNIRLMTVETFE